MIDDFERAVAFGNDLETVRKRLCEAAQREYNERLLQISRDFDEARLILFGLAQPTQTTAYGIARGMQRFYHRKHYSGPSLAEMLMRDVRKEEWMDKRVETEEAVKNDDVEQAETSDT